MWLRLKKRCAQLNADAGLNVDINDTFIGRVLGQMKVEDEWFEDHPGAKLSKEHRARVGRAFVKTVNEFQHDIILHSIEERLEAKYVKGLFDDEYEKLELEWYRVVESKNKCGSIENARMPDLEVIKENLAIHLPHLDKSLLYGYVDNVGGK